MGKSLREFIDRLARTRVGDDAFNLSHGGAKLFAEGVRKLLI